VTLLHGPEPFLLDDAVARVTRALFPGQAELSLSREILDSRAAGPEAIVQAALTLPWLGARRLVVARGVESLPAKAAEPLAAYVKAPNPSTALVLVADALLDGAHWLLRALPPAAVVPAPAPAGRALAGWLRAHAQASGYELREDAAGLLVELSGDDLTRLVGEVEKAALAGGPENRRVTVAEIRAVVGEHRLRHVFDLTRALSARDAAAALASRVLLNAGRAARGAGMLTREARATWRAADALRAGRAPEEIARACGGRPPRPPPCSGAERVCRGGGAASPAAGTSSGASLAGPAPRAVAARRRSVRDLTVGSVCPHAAALLGPGAGSVGGAVAPSGRRGRGDRGPARGRRSAARRVPRRAWMPISRPLPRHVLVPPATESAIRSGARPRARGGRRAAAFPAWTWWAWIRRPGRGAAVRSAACAMRRHRSRVPHPLRPASPGRACSACSRWIANRVRGRIFRAMEDAAPGRAAQAPRHRRQRRSGPGSPRAACTKRSTRAGRAQGDGDDSVAVV
jgi:DNA polymerase-3 subunit delta